MKYIQTMQRGGRLLFAFMWVPFICIFAGTASEMFGSAGVRFTDWVNQYLPGFVSSNGELSLLSEISIGVTIALSVLSMFLIFGSVFVSAAFNKRLRQNGKPATAKVVSLASTGTRINGQPVVRFMLEVQPSDRSAFHAETEQLVDQVNLPRLQPGHEVQVRYDPDSLDVALADL
ncbi:MAG: DUF3592 domain-containing protein [Anaerolineales bacterium]|nr:DUF3592 domain-containing protein [Anaerolineales bacterium]